MHKGEIIENVIRKLDIPIAHIAKRCEISRRQLYNIFDQAEVANEVILKIGRGINYDFAQEFPWLTKVYQSMPELRPKVLRTEEERSIYLAKKRTEITISLDGSEETLEEALEKIKRFNSVINQS